MRKNSLLELENDFTELKDREVKVENICYNWLVNYILELIRKTVGSFKDKIVSLFKTNTPEKYGKKTVYGSGNRPSKLKIQKQSEDNTIKCIKNLFELKKENETIKDLIK